jgi:signal transduction histidine kinase
MGYAGLSLRHKLPLWGAFLIVATAVAVIGSNLLLTRESIKKNLLLRSEVLGRSLASSLSVHVAKDDVWRAFQTIYFPVQAERRQPSFQLENIVVLDTANRIFVSSDTQRYPLMATADKVDAALGQAIRQPSRQAEDAVTVEGTRILLTIPLLAKGDRLGTLVMIHPADYYRPAFERVLKRNAWAAAAVLLTLLPIMWFWGRRLAAPLALLADHMGGIGRESPKPLPASHIYPHPDELGRLFSVYDRIRQEMLDKEAFERQMLKEDRLAAIGRLAAGMAHEINNPLGGMLTALDTLKRHGAPDPLQSRVLSLLERGLRQIQDIVAALLVEAKAKSRPLTPQDVEDTHILLSREAEKRHVKWDWSNALDEVVRLPATLVRQVLINLLLNAVQAAGEGGEVVARITPWEGGGVEITIGNSGREISPGLMDRLFEPFTGDNEEGSGLGLWISYQIVQQLKGRIEVASVPGWTRFHITLPPGDETWLLAESA